MHFIWVSMDFSTKVLTGNTIFKSPTGDETAVLRGPAIFRAKAVPSFPSYFKTLSIDPLPGIERSTSRSTIKSSTDWDNPAAVTITIEDHTIHPLLARSLDTQLFVTNVLVKTLFSYLFTRSPTLSCLKATILPAVRITQKADLANYKLASTPFVFGAS